MTMKRRTASLSMTVLIGLALLSAVAHAQDPLPSWNDGKAKQAIVAFVAKVTKEGSPDFVPPAERIATFDNDGTLWAEQPMYFQLLFALDRVKALAPQHPEWKDKEPFASLLKGDVKGALAGGETRHARDHHGHARRHDHRGVREDREGLDRHREASRRPSGLTPRWSISRCSNCSPTCARTASRPSSSPAAASSSCARGRRRSMASRPSRSSAAAIKTKFEMRDGKPVLMRLPEVELHRRQGRQARRHPRSTSAAAPSPRSAIPTATCRCCNGPPPAAARASASTSTTPTPSANGPTTAQSHIGQLDKGLDEAQAKRLDGRRA